MVFSLMVALCYILSIMMMNMKKDTRKSTMKTKKNTQKIKDWLATEAAPIEAMPVEPAPPTAT